MTKAGRVERGPGAEPLAMPRLLWGRALMMRGRRPHILGGMYVDARTRRVAGDEDEAETGLPCA